MGYQNTIHLMYVHEEVTAAVVEYKYTQQKKAEYVFLLNHALLEWRCKNTIKYLNAKKVEDKCLHLSLSSFIENKM